jgi:hypothetical protein
MRSRNWLTRFTTPRTAGRGLSGQPSSTARCWSPASATRCGERISLASRGSGKWFSLQQENRIAARYGGTVSPSSGGAESDQGDIRTNTDLIECKHTGKFDKPAKSISVKLADVEKIADEAWSEGRRATIALSLYAPDSPLARGGYVDLIVRHVEDDVTLMETEYRLRDLED